MIGMGYCRIEEFQVKYLWARFCRKPCPNSSEQKGVYRSVVLEHEDFYKLHCCNFKNFGDSKFKIVVQKKRHRFSFQQLKIKQYF